MINRFDLNARHVLVTGASSGLGRHFAGVLAAAGGRVSVAARRVAALEETVAAIRASGAQAHGVRMDVTDAASVAQGFAEAEAQFGPVGILINNAGVTGTRAALEVTESDWSSIIDTNLKGNWLVAQHAARRMVQNGGGGSVVNIASDSRLACGGRCRALCDFESRGGTDDQGAGAGMGAAQNPG